MIGGDQKEAKASTMSQEPHYKVSPKCNPVKPRLLWCRYRLCAKFGDHVSITAWYEAFASVVGGPSAVTAPDHVPDPPPEPFAGTSAQPTDREFPLQRVRGRGKPRKKPPPKEKQEEGKQNGGESEAVRPLTEEERATLQYPCNRSAGLTFGSVFIASVFVFRSGRWCKVFLEKLLQSGLAPAFFGMQKCEYLEFAPRPWQWSRFFCRLKNTVR